jgi:hypothetical protein
MRLIALSVLVLAVLGTGVAEAQFNASFTQSAPEIVIEPSLPSPYSVFTASLNNYAVGGGDSITWFINGVKEPSFLNQRSITLTARGAGEPLRITAASQNESGTAVEATATVVPHFVDLIIEPQTRTPSFYRARALPTTGSQINATVLVDAGAIPHTDLSYRFTISGGVLFGGPVRGQNQVSFTTPTGDGVFGVEIEQVSSGAVIGRRSVTLISNEPILRFYEVSPLYGLLLRPLVSLNLIGNSTTIRAEPYYLDLRTYNNPDIAEWQIDQNATAVTGQNPYELTLVRSGLFGTAVVDFHVRSRTSVVQGARASVEVRL